DPGPGHRPCGPPRVRPLLAAHPRRRRGPDPPGAAPRRSPTRRAPQRRARLKRPQEFSCLDGAARDDDSMSDAIPSPAARPGVPVMRLGLAWLGSPLGTSVVGWSVGGLPERLLLGASVLGFVADGAVASNRRRTVTLAFSAAASTVMITAGAVAAVLIASPE